MEINGYHVEDEFFGYKIKKSIQRLKTFEPEDGYYLAFSGGKDSQCIYHLAKMGGVKFDAEYRVTTVDPPELIHFIKDKYPDVHFSIPHDKDGKPITMWNLIEKKLLPPTRIVRYCCQKLKESGGVGRVTVTGVRWAESAKRKNSQGAVAISTRSKKLYAQAMGIDGGEITKQGNIILNEDNDEAKRMVEQCFRTRKTLVNPIIDWTDEEVWMFLNDVVKVPHCELYDRGHKRLGCIGCPITVHRAAELEEYPKYKQAYLRAFKRMLDERERRGLETDWNTPEEVMEWWLSN